MLSPQALAESARSFEQGAKAADAGRWENARQAFLEAWKIRQHWKVAANLGRAEINVGKYRDAAEHLAFFLREAPSLGAADRKASQQMLDRARAKVGTLTITVSPPGADVLVDGHVVGKAPLPGPVFVDPGPVFVEAQLDGYTQERVTRTAAAGKEESVSLQLAKVAVDERGGTTVGGVGPTVVPDKPIVPDKPVLTGTSTENAKRVAGFVLLGVGGAALVTGVVTGALVLADRSKAHGQCSPSTCGPDAQGTWDSAHILATVNTAMLSVGAGLCATGIALAVMGSREQPKIGLGVTTTPGGGRLTFRAEF